MQGCTHTPQTTAGRVYRPRKPRASALYQCTVRHAPELRSEGGFGRRVEENVIGRFLACGDPQYGFARIYCDLVNYNPHIHVLAADGAFDADGGFTVLPTIPRKVLESAFRKGVLDLFRREGLVSDLLAERMCAWRHTGFSVHSAVRIHARDAAGRRRLAQYMLRAPFSLEKMSYEPVSGAVIYRSRMHKTLKRNFQIMSGADWLAQLCRHISDRFEHLVRYAGWYSNRSRGKRRCMKSQPAEVATRQIDVREAARVRSTWARLIHKVYKVDPLGCPKCKGPMRVIALIDDKAVIRKILAHLGLWAPQIVAGKGPGPPAPDPPEASAPILTYHPVPDIA